MSEDGTDSPLRRDLRAAEGSRAEEAPSTETPPPSPAAPQAPTSPPLGDLGADIEHPEASARIPGDTRRPLTRFPTDPIGIVPTYEVGPELDAPEPLLEWEPAPTPVVKGALAPWALGAAILALVVSFFVGWGVPIGLLAVGTAIVALRRPIESHGIARWALVLGLVSTAFSLGWLIWAAMALERLG